MLVGIDKTGRWLLPDQTALLAQASNPALIKLNREKQAVSLLPFPSEKNLVALTPSSGPGLAFDVILPILHGTFGEDGTIQGLLELSQIPYVGSGVLGSSLCMDKEMAKKVLQAENIPVVPFMTVRKNEFQARAQELIDEADKRFGFPFFVKPANMGSSVGVNKIKTRDEAQKKFEDAFLYDTKVLVEKFIKGRELEIAILGNHEPQASIVGEIVPRHEFYSYEAKYIDEHGADLKIPAPNLKEDTLRDIRFYALEAFKKLECFGLARVDFFFDETHGKLYLNEINTIPGFTKISMYPKLWEASGITYSDLLDRLIDLALERAGERRNLKTTYEPKT